MSYIIGRIIFKLLSKIYFPVTIKGVENLPKSGSFILAANHASNLDPFVIGSFCGHVLSFVAKESLFKNKLLGTWIMSLGAFPIRRDTADFRALREALRRLKKGPLLIFPEGTRKSVDGQKPVQPGIGFIVAKSGLPVYPVFVDGSIQVLPPGAKWFKRHPITLTFGKAINFPSQDNYSQIASQIVQNIYSLSV